VARGKANRRTEQRRRYRSILRAQAGESPEAELEEEEAGEAESRASSAQLSRPTAVRLRPDPLPTKPVGFFGAMKAAYRPIHYRDDLKLIVPLITRTNAIWPVVVFCGFGLAAVLIRRDPHDFWYIAAATICFGQFGLPMIPPMIAGFLAPRAGWLMGIVASLIWFGMWMAWFLSGATPQTNSLGQVTGYGLPEGFDLAAATISYLPMTLVIGALMAALSAWYKRFLALTGPAAQLARQQAARDKTAKGTESGKATARR
jgi:hypothetical protein